MDTIREKIKSVELIEDNEDYVYDISVAEGDPFFFGNDILLHNTDSCYFSAYTTLEEDIRNGNIAWNKENVTSLYDTISNQVNDTFIEYMQNAFHCPAKRGQVIRAGREIVALKGLFITKKRYAVLVYDKEGKRKDTGGKIGQIKAKGLDLIRADTPVAIQQFLGKVLEMLLSGEEQQAVLDHIRQFRTEFKSQPAWCKGSPKRANNIASYEKKEQQQGRATLPGHVRASINWNTLKRMHGDRYSMNIVDGAKVVVCRLRDNPMEYTSVAYPVDELHLPDWFKELPFDETAMEYALIDEKLDNLIGVLKWDLSSTKTDTTFNTLFSFE